MQKEGREEGLERQRFDMPPRYGRDLENHKKKKLGKREEKGGLVNLNKKGIAERRGIRQGRRRVIGSIRKEMRRRNAAS